jgi:nucleosome binding factor SPN SPT16 subunit
VHTLLLCFRWNLPDLPNASALAAGPGNKVGFRTGVEHRDRALRISPKNDLPVQECMIFRVASLRISPKNDLPVQECMTFKVVAVGSERLKDAQYGPYSLFLEDTVRVRGRDLKPDIFTASARTEFQFTNYQLGGDGEVLTEDGADDGAGGTRKGCDKQGCLSTQRIRK